MESPQLGLLVADDASLFLNRDSSVEEVVIAEDFETNSESHSSHNSPELSFHKYEMEWQFLISQDETLMMLRKQALSGCLRGSRFRSVCWRLLLGVLSPGHPRKWIKQTKASRSNYQELFEKTQVDPWLSDQLDNPLSQDAESPWHQYFCDQELRNIIRMDVVRTFPGVEFFRDGRIQETMVNVLFCYARDHPSMCYRQGMHEILAPLLFVVHCDCQTQLHLKQIDNDSDTIGVLLNPNYLEADCYALFVKVMFGIQGSYQISNVAPSSTGYFPTNSTPTTPPVSEVLHQLDWVREHLLAPIDPELHQHLQQLDVTLPLFGIRWLRLLFGREFPLQDLLVLWDAIFSEGNMFQLVNYIMLAMLMAIRRQLLTSDHTSCLTLLMRYPAMDVSKIIDHALYLKNPKIYEQPSQTVICNQLLVSTVVRPDTSRGSNPPTKQLRPQKLDKKEKNESNFLTNRLKRLSLRSNSQSETPPSESSSNIIDGFMLDDPGVVRSELKHSRAVMALVQLKLAQYHDVLEQCVPHTNIAAQQALTGIHELCSLLDPHRPSPSPSPSCIEVEPAYEVGEIQVTPSTTPTPSNLPPPCSEVDMTIFKKTQGHPIETIDNLVRSPSKK